MPPRGSQTNYNDITKLNQPQPILIRMMNNIFSLPTHAHSTYSVLFCSVLFCIFVVSLFILMLMIATFYSNCICCILISLDSDMLYFHFEGSGQYCFRASPLIIGPLSFLSMDVFGSKIWGPCGGSQLLSKHHFVLQNIYIQHEINEVYSMCTLVNYRNGKERLRTC